MNIRVAVLRKQTEIVIRCTSGSFTLHNSTNRTTLTPGEECRFSLAVPAPEVWILRKRLSRNPIPNGEQIGVVAQTKHGGISSRKWVSLISALPPQSPDPLFAQALAIAQSAAPDGELYYPDERLNETASILIGWTPGSHSVEIVPDSPNSTISIQNVQIGIGFHWDRHDTVEYSGTLHIYALNNGLAAVVETSLEEYLATVNSSEMPAEMPLEFLKAQTVAARSWLLANLGSHHPGAPFDVCSDDHCQCYQGSTKLKANSVRAAQETTGEILVCMDSEGSLAITDARYAKTCGGRFEPGNRIWGGETPGLPYAHDHVTEAVEPITSETVAEQIIRSTTADDYCNPSRYPYPPALQYCEPYYRWQQRVSREELGARVTRATGMDIGAILDLTCVERGPSGRIHKLQVTGSANSVEIVGELAIRRALSDSHLPSSATVWEAQGGLIVLYGAGWGHGAGLCQTGAAIRAMRGAEYTSILAAYYPDSKLEIMTSCKR